MKKIFYFNLPAKIPLKAGMCKSFIIAFVLCFTVCLNCFGQVANNFKSPENVNFTDVKDAQYYQQFLENQQTPLLNADEEAFKIGDVIWQRKYGEEDYFLAPSMQDISAYKQRIRQLDDKENGIYKSKFHFLNVEVTELSKSFLISMGINVPDYVLNNVIVWLPEIDIDVLNNNGINYNILDTYGQTTGEIIDENKINRSTIWSEDFEGSFPGSNYTVTYASGHPNCVWDDVSCNYYSGNWSIWCAAGGTDAPSTDCSSYINNMNATVKKTYAIDFSAYTNVQFKFWYKANCEGDYDAVELYHENVTTGVSTFAWGASYSPNNNWEQKTFSLSNITSYRWIFVFYSDVSIVNEGVYFDYMQITGDALPCTVSVPTGTTVSSSSGSTNISVTSNGTGTWSASESCSWVSLSPSSGTGNGSVTASYQQNTTSSQRSCTITFNCGSNTDTYTLTQEAPPCTVSVPTGTTVSSSSGSTNISVTSNGTGTWSASESCSWVSLSPSSGTGNGSVTASYQQNTSSSQRSCTITFNCGSNTDTYTLTQEAPTCSVSVPHGTIVSSDAGFKIIPVTTNCDELTWSASESCSWVSLSPSSGTGNGSVTATYQQNTSSSQRSCTITFFCSSNTDTYTLTQEAPPCSISIIAPNGSTDWQTGTSHNIEWTDNISENVKIELYKGGNLHSTLTTPSTPSDGSWNWSIPSDLTTGTDYKIKITSISNSNCYDYSDNFTISYGDNIEEVMLSKYITKIYPNPAYDKLYVEFTDNINKIEELSLYNTLGQVVYSINGKNIQAKNFVIDLSKYKSGIYYLNIQTKEDGIIRNRIIIVR